ncbi:MAG: N-(5'-phosphoribosyl)anthranilate isomerase [Flavobacteriaceae bacterium]|nr:N-(5'-phosphoribosyl)anthranilate isomerase [Flavobacteriaceae bacterium]|tara:strand:- start:51907 stop:52530 length:624 start_codon:yes stop_codon:yes gene_type:complete
MKLKVCGMKYEENIRAIADLNPDYLGFIFYSKSKRNFEGEIPALSNDIKKTGVFVNESIDKVNSLIEEHQLQAVQLHGDESVSYVKELKSKNEDVEIIKVFGIKDSFDFSALEDYQSVVDYFLFDTKGKERGGNGVKFDWMVLKDYPYQTPIFLSGGIGLEDIEEIRKIQTTGLPIYAVDVNSKFEIEPGLKNMEDVQRFKTNLVAL